MQQLLRVVAWMRAVLFSVLLSSNLWIPPAHAQTNRAALTLMLAGNLIANLNFASFQKLQLEL